MELAGDEASHELRPLAAIDEKPEVPWESVAAFSTANLGGVRDGTQRPIAPARSLDRLRVRS